MKTTAEAQAVAVAERLLQPETVLAAVPGPEGASLAHGLAGTALLHARLATLDPVFRAAADRHWAAAASHARRNRAAGAGIFATGGGLAASLIIGTGYLPDAAAWQAPASQAATWLSQQAQRIASDLGQRRRGGDPYARRAAYDVISGLAGIGRVLLAAITAGQPPAEPGLTAALQALTTMIEAPHGARPGWWLPASMHPPAAKVAPSGSAATGMADGIAGPLAFLAAAQARGWAVPGQDAAIRSASQWLLDWKAAGTYQWPASISGAELAHPSCKLRKVSGGGIKTAHGLHAGKRARQQRRDLRQLPDDSLAAQAPAVGIIPGAEYRRYGLDLVGVLLYHLVGSGSGSGIWPGRGHAERWQLGGAQEPFAVADNSRPLLAPGPGRCEISSGHDAQRLRY
jgi:hypothetical protein